MKKKELIRFKNKLESEREIFDIPELPDGEFKAMLMQAKVKVNLAVEVNNKENMLRKLMPVFSSLKLSATLSLAIIVAMIIGYTFIFNGGLLYRELSPSNKNSTTAKSRTNNLPVVNVSVKGPI